MGGKKKKGVRMVVSCVLLKVRVLASVYVVLNLGCKQKKERMMDVEKKKEFQVLKDRERVGKYIQNGRAFVIVIMGRG